MRVFYFDFFRHLEDDFSFKDCRGSTFLRVFFIVTPIFSLVCGLMCYLSLISSYKKITLGAGVAELFSGFLLVLGLGVVLLVLALLGRYFSCYKPKRELSLDPLVYSAQ